MNKSLKQAFSIGSLAALFLAVLQTPIYANGEVITQWAISGTASSSYTNWEPIYATGAPDTEECDDRFAAWASAGDGDTVDWLAMEFETAVIPQEINIFQNNIKGAISKVEVSKNGTDWIQVYSGNVADWSWGACDESDTTVFYDILTVDSSNGNLPNFAINRVKITVDQTIAEEWAEIDAVQLVGLETPNVRASATVKPSISGKAISTKAGSNKLTVNKGTWIGTPEPTFTYKWYSCSAKVEKVRQSIPDTCKIIAGETKKTLAVSTSLKGKFISVKVIGASEGTNPTWYLSKSTEKVK